MQQARRAQAAQVRRVVAGCSTSKWLAHHGWHTSPRIACTCAQVAQHPSSSSRLQPAWRRTASGSRRQRPAHCRAPAPAAAAASPGAAAAAAPAATQPPQQAPRAAKDVVTAFYTAYNTRDLAAIECLIADDIRYHDLVYEEPHEGREGVMAWLRKV